MLLRIGYIEFGIGRNQAPMSDIDLRLLGGFEACTRSGAALSFPTKKTQALLAYLAVNPGKRHSRSSLASLLWGNSGDDQARASLRQTLTYLRKSLAPGGSGTIVAQGDSVYVEPTAIEVDAARLESLITRGGVEALERALDLYRGEFLEGVDLRDPEFNDWLREERIRLRNLVIEGSKELLSIQIASDHVSEALKVANRLLTIDPLQEDVHRAIMRLHLCRGERVPALNQYDTCRQVLDRELGIEPDEETERLLSEARTLRSGRDDGAALTKLDQSNEAGDRTSLTAGHERQSDKRKRIALIPVISIIVFVVVAAVAWVGERVDFVPQKTVDGREIHVESYRWTVPRKGSSIAVLRFRNLSSDPQREFLADAFTEGVTAKLSRFRDLLVTARQTSMRYGDPHDDVLEIGRKLGVQYVLQGSVQAFKDRCRVAVQLVDAKSGRHVWAEHYEKPLNDVFVVQDEITRQIAGSLGAISGPVKRSELARGIAKPRDRLAAYDYFLRGLWHIERLTREDNAVAKENLRKAIELDPTFAKAYAKLAIVYWLDYALGSLDRGEAFELVRQYADAAVRIDPDEAWSYWAIAYVRLHGERRYEDALKAFEKALALNPNDADVLSEYGWTLAWAGRAKEGIAHMQAAIRLNPHHPEWYLNNLAVGYLVARDHEQVVSTLSRMTMPDTAEHLYLAASFARLGQFEEARARIEAALMGWPNFTLKQWLETRPFARVEDREYFEESLKLAGISY